MTEKEMILELVKKQHQIVMDATIWVYGPLGSFGFMDEEEDGYGEYTVIKEWPDRLGNDLKIIEKAHTEEWLFKTPEEAVDKYLELVAEWTGKEELWKVQEK